MILIIKIFNYSGWWAGDATPPPFPPFQGRHFSCQNFPLNRRTGLAPPTRLSPHGGHPHREVDLLRRHPGRGKRYWLVLLPCGGPFHLYRCVPSLHHSIPILSLFWALFPPLEMTKGGTQTCFFVKWFFVFFWFWKNFHFLLFFVYFLAFFQFFFAEKSFIL